MKTMKTASRPAEPRLMGTVLGNTADVDGPNTPTVTAFSIAAVGEGPAIVGVLGQPTLIPGIGSLTLSATGAYTFKPALNYNGPVPVVTYTVTDGVDTETSTLTINVTPVNDSLVDGNELNDRGKAVAKPGDTAFTGTVPDFDQLAASALVRQSMLVPNPRRPRAPVVLPFSAATLWRRVADGSFPAPVRMGRITAWKVADVRAWLLDQAEC